MTYIPPVRVGDLCVLFLILVFALGVTPILGFLDTNMLVTPTQNFKPIFRQKAKYLASGVGVGQCTRRQNFALPNAKYTNMLVSLAFFAFLPHAKPKSCVLPDAKPKRKPVEYRSRWVPTQNFRVGHVHFMFFV